MGGFPFFFSYARDNGNSYLDQFVEDLAERVRGRLGLLKSEPAIFRDAGEIEIGQPWPDVLLAGLQTSKVMVCLYTPLYFTRPICGQEIGFFQEREKLMGDTAERFILPLLWIPSEDCIPEPLRELNFVHGDLPATYRTKGMETLTRQSSGRYRDDYDQAVDAIAKRIYALAKRIPALPSLPEGVRLKEIRNAFLPEEAVDAVPPVLAEMQAKGPNAVGFVYVAGTKQELAAKNNKLFYGDRKAAEWCPFVSKRQMIGALAPIIAGSRNFLTTTLALDETIANRIEAIEQDNSILVLIVDTWTLHLMPKYENWMAKFDRINSLHTSVIVIWNEDDLDSKQHENLLKWQIAQTFATQSTREEVFFRPTITNPADFETALADSLIRLQDKIIQNKETRQVLANSPFRKKPEIANAR